MRFVAGVLVADEVKDSNKEEVCSNFLQFAYSEPKPQREVDASVNNYNSKNGKSLGVSEGYSVLTVGT